MNRGKAVSSEQRTSSSASSSTVPRSALRAPRFFVDFPLAEGQDVALTGALAHQLGRVLRLRPGATIVLLDGSGREFTVE